MTIRLEMLQAAGKAKNLLGDSTETVIQFTYNKLGPEGGFISKGGHSDLYYTFFGIEILKALDEDIPYELIISYLQKFNIEELDMVHLSSLVRCHANLADSSEIEITDKFKTEVLNQLKYYTTEDGGYNTMRNVKNGNLYGCFLAMGLYEDLELTLPSQDKFIDFIQSLRREGGGYTNEKTFELSTTPATAAALVLLKHLDKKPSQSSFEWLLSQYHPSGGFCAIPSEERFKIADLLSTATSLYALSINDVSLKSIREQCLDYLDSLWKNEGGFAGNLFDTDLDCEYTYYGLLSLGHLSD